MVKYPLFVMTHALSYFLYQSIALFTMLCWHSADDEFADSRMQCVHISNKCTAVCKVATQLRELTCHMGSHSVTCHPAEVTFPPLPQPKLAWIKRPRRDGRLSWPSWLVTYRDGIPARRRSPVQVLMGPMCVNFVHATNAANHYATPPTRWSVHSSHFLAVAIAYTRQFLNAQGSYFSLVKNKTNFMLSEPRSLVCQRRFIVEYNLFGFHKVVWWHF